MQTQELPVFDTKPLFRPDQVEDAKNTIESLQEKLQDRHIEDKAEVAKQLRRVTANFNDQVPRPPTSVEEEDRMQKRSRQLLAEFRQGMPSAEEMRKAPDGAVSKHMAWEKKNKKKIEEWRNLQLRLSHGQDRECTKIERFRPRDSTLGMHSAFIPGQQYFLPPDGAGRSVAFSEDQLAMLRSIAPDVADKIGLMNNEQRGEIKEIVDSGLGMTATPSQASIDGKRGVEKREAMRGARKARKKEKKARPPASPELRAARIANLTAGLARKAAEKAARESGETS